MAPTTPEERKAGFFINLLEAEEYLRELEAALEIIKRHNEILAEAKWDFFNKCVEKGFSRMESLSLVIRDPRWFSRKSL